MKQAAKQYGVMAEIGRIITSSHDIKEIYEKFAKVVNRLISFDRIAIVLIDPGGQSVRCDYVKGAKIPSLEPGDTFLISGTITEKVVKSRQGRIIQGKDLQRWLKLKKNGKHIAVVQVGLQSAISVPLISKNQVIGVLHIRTKKANAYTKADLRLAEKISAQISGAIANAKLIAEQQKLEEKTFFQSSLINQVRNAVIATDLDRKIIFWNRFAEVLFQWKSEEAIGRMITEMISEQELTTLKQSGHWEGECIGIRKDGSTFPAFLMNSIFRNKEGKVRGMVFVANDIIERKRAEDSLRESEKKYRDLFEESKDAVFITTAHGQLVDINPAGLELFGYSSKEEILSINVPEKLYYDPNDRDKVIRAFAENGYVRDYELSLKKKNGEKIIVLMTATAIRGSHGHVIGYRGILRDVTEKKDLEEQLLQSQKMEAIGLLAGGIAHDFNNLLMVIQGNVELSLMNLDPSHPICESLLKIEEGAQKASNLTHQLLAFGRRQVLNPKILNVSDLIENLSRMLTRLIGEDIELRIEIKPNLRPIYADSSAMDQILMNLIVNAREAMPQGGVLILQTRNIDLNEDFCHQHPFVNPGEYVQISVMDTGRGMDEKTLSRIFEPFFTTKEKGSGLGLAVVYGIVKQHRGHIFVSSQIGKGSRFDLYLPAYQGTLDQEILETVLEEIPGGAETILVAEDEREVRELLKILLEGLGYNVLIACDGEEAIRTFSEHRNQIDLVILDAVMPKMNGPLVYQHIASTVSHPPCLFLSGYSEEVVERYFDRSLNIPILHKPVTLRNLGKKVREILDQAKRV